MNISLSELSQNKDRVVTVGVKSHKIGLNRDYIEELILSYARTKYPDAELHKENDKYILRENSHLIAETYIEKIGTKFESMIFYEIFSIDFDRKPSEDKPHLTREKTLNNLFNFILRRYI